MISVSAVAQSYHFLVFFALLGILVSFHLIANVALNGLQAVERLKRLPYLVGGLFYALAELLVLEK